MYNATFETERTTFLGAAVRGRESRLKALNLSFGNLGKHNLTPNQVSLLFGSSDRRGEVRSIRLLATVER